MVDALLQTVSRTHLLYSKLTSVAIQVPCKHVQVLATWESNICKQQKDQSHEQEVVSHCAGLVTKVHTEQAYSLQFTQSRLTHYDEQSMTGCKAA